MQTRKPKKLLIISIVNVTLVGISLILYVFSYLPISQQREVKAICEKIKAGADATKFLSKKDWGNLNFFTYPNDKPSSENPSISVISGGWMTSCHITHYEGKVLTTEYSNN